MRSEPSAGSAKLLPEALDFAPDLLAIQERPPARMPRVLLLSTVSLVGLLLLWACLARVDIVASAPGKLVATTFTKVVQPAESGIVSEISVRDGQRVQEGQLLMRLDPRLAQADTVATATEVALLKLTLARIDAELAERPLVPHESERLDLFAQVDAQFRARKQALSDAIAQETEGLRRAEAELQAAQHAQALARETLPLYEQSAQAYRKLLQEGFVGELAAAEKGREAMEKARELQVHAAGVASAGAVIEQGRRRIVSLRSQHRSALENERMELVSRLNRSDQDQQRSSVRASLLEIRAPHAGIVTDLAVTTRGAVVAAGHALMNLVPVDEPLQAEVMLRNEDVGFVAVGQKVKLKIAAYPFQKHGMLDGEVALISADAADPRQGPAGEQPPRLSYRAIVKLDGSSTPGAADGGRLRLGAGMSVNAEIHQGERSVIEYLLSPVKKVVHEAARER